MDERKTPEMQIHNTTLRLPEDLRKDLRIEAAVRNTSLHQLILEFLREKVGESRKVTA